MSRSAIAPTAGRGAAPAVSGRDGRVVMSAQPRVRAASHPIGTSMHASIWRFCGDPDDLLARYDAMAAEIPESSFLFHACLSAAEGLVVVDMCPSREAFQEFRDAEWFQELLTRHGLPVPEIEDHPVHVAMAAGQRVQP